MLEHFDKIETDLVKYIYVLFLDKFERNKTRFANASECTETTVRIVFLHKQRMTLNLFLRFCFALETNPVDLLNKIEK